MRTLWSIVKYVVCWRLVLFWVLLLNIIPPLSLYCDIFWYMRTLWSIVKYVVCWRLVLFWVLLLNIIPPLSLYYDIFCQLFSDFSVCMSFPFQFVELKGSVFKKFEKKNLFQMSCSDVRERFHFMILLSIVCMRNLTEFNWNMGKILISTTNFQRFYFLSDLI